MTWVYYIFTFVCTVSFTEKFYKYKYTLFLRLISFFQTKRINFLIFRTFLKTGFLGWTSDIKLLFKDCRLTLSWQCLLIWFKIYWRFSVLNTNQFLVSISSAFLVSVLNKFHFPVNLLLSSAEWAQRFIRDHSVNFWKQATLYFINFTFQ